MIDKKKVQKVLTKRKRSLDYILPIINRCIHWLSLNGTEKQGIFNSTTVPLNKIYDLEDSLQLSPSFSQEHDVLVVVSLVNTLLQEIPDSLMTTKLYSAWIKTGEKQDITLIQQCLQFLPTENKEILLCLLDFLHKVRTKQNINKIPTSSLAQWLAKLILRPEEKDFTSAIKLVSILIDNYKEFKDPDTSVSDHSVSSQMFNTYNSIQILHQFPESSLIHIFKFLSVHSLGRITTVCKLWNKYSYPAKIHRVQLSLFRSRSFLDSLGSYYQAQEPVSSSIPILGKSIIGEKSRLQFTIRQIRMAPTLSVLEEIMSSVGTQLLTKIAELMAITYTIRQQQESDLNRLGVLTKHLCKLSVSVRIITKHLFALSDLKRGVEEFMEFPDTKPETYFLNYLWDLFHQHTISTKPKEFIITEAVAISTLLYIWVVHNTTHLGAKNFAIALSKRLEFFLENYENLQHVTDDDILASIKDHKKKKTFNFGTSIEFSNHKKVKTDDIFNESLVNSLIMENSTTAQHQYVLYSKLREREKKIPQIRKDIDNHMLRITQRLFLLTKKLTTSTNDLLRVSVGNTPQHVTLYRINRELLEDYAEKHRLDDPIARGTISNYIRETQPNLENFDVSSVIIDCSRLDLTGINLFGANLRGCTFENTNLSYSSLYDCDLTGVSFRNANLAFCQLKKAILTNANFEGANLTGVDEEIITKKILHIDKTKEQKVRNMTVIEYLLVQVTALEKLLDDNELNDKEIQAIFPILAIKNEEILQFSQSNFIENIKKYIRDNDGILECVPSHKLNIPSLFSELVKISSQYNLQVLLVEITDNILSRLSTIQVDTEEERNFYNNLKLEIAIKRLKTDGERFLTEMKTPRRLTDSKVDLIQKFLKQYTHVYTTYIEITGNFKLEEYFIDMTSIEFTKVNLRGINLTGIKMSAEQIVGAIGINSVIGLDNKILYAAQKEKFKLCNVLLQRGFSIINECKCFINEGEILDRIAYPSDESEVRRRLDSFTDIQVRIILFYVLTSFIINRLDASHPFSAEQSSISNIKFLEEDVQEAKNKIIDVLKNRKFQLNREVTALTYNDRVSRFYDAVGDVHLETSDIQATHIDLLPEDMNVVLPELEKLLELRKQVLRTHDEIMTKSGQNYINSLIQDLYKPPDPFFDEDAPKEAPLRRITQAISAAGDKFTIDLRHCDLEGINFKEIQIPPDVKIKLKPQQIYTYLTRQQQLERSNTFQTVIKSGNIEEVKLWIELGVLFNAQASDGRYPLMDACYNEQTEIAKLLLENGANDPTKINEIIEGVCRLHAKTPEEREKQAEIVALLREYGGNLDLHSAVAMGDLESVKAKVKQSRDNPAKLINMLYHGETPLHIAVQFGHEELVLHLLLHNANPSIPNRNNQTPLQIACRTGQIRIAQTLTDSDVNIVDSEGNSLLFLVAKKGYYSLADHLIQKRATIDLQSAVLLDRIKTLVYKIQEPGVDINKAISRDKKTLLHLAAEFDKKKVLDWLLKNNADVNTTMHLNQTPLMIACKHGHVDIVQMLIKHQNNINTHSSHKERSPLWIAVNMGHKAVVKVLLENNANPNSLNCGRSCLHEAVRKGILSVAKMLVSSGANPLMVDIEGNIPLHMATTIGRKDMVDFLVSAILNVKNNNGKSAFELLSPDCPDKDAIASKLKLDM